VANFSFKDIELQRCFTVTNKASKALIFFAAIILGAVSISAPADVEGSEFLFKPSILLSEEYNDNVLLTTESKYDDYITRIAPAFSAVYRAHNWDWNVDYNYNYLYYAKKTTQNDSSFDLNLVNKNRIIEDVLFLDVRDQYSRVSLDVTRDYTKESNFVNQSDRNLLTINPYFVLKPLSKMSVTTGYIYMDTWYKDPLAIDRTDHVGYADVRQELSSRSAMIAGVSHTLDMNTVEGYTQDDLYLGQYFEYAENSTVTFKAGNTWFDFESKGRVSQVFWEATITHRYPTVTVTYETGLRFIPDPLQNLRREDRYLATIRKDVERTSLVISGGLIEYREAEHKHLENTSYQMTGTISHSITTKSKLMLKLAAERLDDNQAGTYLETYRTGVRFEYLALEKLTLALDYRYTNVYSTDISTESYDNNRFTVELRKVF
jgi:hypothetical protein